MKIRLVKIGKVGRKQIVELTADFEKRLRGLAKVETVEFRDLSGADTRGRPQRRTTAELIRGLKKGPGDIVVVLDERGETWTSPDLAAFVQKCTDNPATKSLAFVVGGPYGLGEEARREADLVWSLSKGVFPSDIAWLLLWEQVYRAYSIIQGTPYHHE